MKSRRSLWTLSLMAVLVAMFVGAGLARAEDKKDDKKDAAGVTGTWKWEFTTQNGDKRETTLKLKQDGDKVTGTVSGRNNQDTEIQDGKFKDGEVSFKVVRKIQQTEVTTTYHGKLDGDTIKGKIETAGGNRSGSRDWEAKREKEAAKPA
jgi:hypothetical protein